MLLVKLNAALFCTTICFISSMYLRWTDYPFICVYHKYKFIRFDSSLLCFSPKKLAAVWRLAKFNFKWNSNKQTNNWKRDQNYDSVWFCRLFVSSPRKKSSLFDNFDEWNHSKNLNSKSIWIFATLHFNWSLNWSPQTQAHQIQKINSGKCVDLKAQQKKRKEIDEKEYVWLVARFSPRSYFSS